MNTRRLMSAPRVWTMHRIRSDECFDRAASASTEQDADVVLFVFCEEYYLANKEPRPGTEEHLKWQTEMDLVMGKAELIIGKQRHGPTGTVQVQFDAHVTRFGDLARDEQLPERIER
jgi:replicative DNA helicase